MHRKLTLRCLTTTLGLLFAASAATVAHARTSEETISMVAAAVRKDGYSALARFTHPEELASFRSTTAPLLEAGLKKSRIRPMLSMFADAYNLKSLRPFADDTDFLAVFLKWMAVQGAPAAQLFKDAELAIIGQVPEGEFRHVVVRLRSTAPNRAGAEYVSVFSLKMHDGTPMLLVLPDVKQAVQVLASMR